MRKRCSCQIWMRLNKPVKLSSVNILRANYNAPLDHSNQGNCNETIKYGTFEGIKVYLTVCFCVIQKYLEPNWLEPKWLRTV